MSSALAINLDRASHRTALPRYANQQPIGDLSKHLHVVPSKVPSLLPQKHEARQAEMRPETIQRTTRNQSDVIPSKADMKRAIKDAIFHSLPAYKITAAEIADRIGANDATVEGWRSREGGVPSAEYTLILMVAFPDFAAQLQGRIGLRAELDPHQEAVLLQLRQVMARSGR